MSFLFRSSSTGFRPHPPQSPTLIIKAPTFMFNQLSGAAHAVMGPRERWQRRPGASQGVDDV